MNSNNSAVKIKENSNLAVFNERVNNFIKFLDVAPLTVQSYISGLKHYFYYLQVNNVKNA